VVQGSSGRKRLAASRTANCSLAAFGSAACGLKLRPAPLRLSTSALASTSTCALPHLVGAIIAEIYRLYLSTAGTTILP
jgi:hypothetical protein